MGIISAVFSYIKVINSSIKNKKNVNMWKMWNKKKKKKIFFSSKNNIVQKKCYLIL